MEEWFTTSFAARAGAGIASFVFSLWLTADNAPLAFFLLPSRAWELAVGGLIAVAGSLDPHADTAAVGAIPARAEPVTAVGPLAPVGYAARARDAWAGRRARGW